MTHISYTYPSFFYDLKSIKIAFYECCKWKCFKYKFQHSVASSPPFSLSFDRKYSIQCKTVTEKRKCHSIEYTFINWMLIKEKRRWTHKWHIYELPICFSFFVSINFLCLFNSHRNYYLFFSFLCLATFLFKYFSAGIIKSKYL